jgi:hypothetical protein
MRSKSALVLFSTAAALALAACAGTTPSAPTATQVALATLGTTAVPEASPGTLPTSEPGASPGGGTGGQATPGPIDPCSLLTQAEASTLMGKSLNAGVSTTLDPDRVCTFKSGLTEVKLFITPPAPNQATADAYWDFARSQFPAGIPIKDLTLFDRSAFGSGSAAGQSLSALFFVDGQYGLDLYCGFPACSETASVAAAELVAGRLP